MLSAAVVDDPAALEPHLGAWDALAVAARMPYCTPAWMLGWWQHARPSRARLHVAVALDAGDLVGIAPCYAMRENGVRHLRMLAAPIAHRTQPLAAAGRDREVAPALAEALARARPGVLALAAVPSESPWPRLLADSWPGRLKPGRRVRETMGAPLLTLQDHTYEEWFAARSGNFRRQMRRAHRSLEEQGATVRLATTPEEIDQDVRAFIRLHHARWDPRGGSAALDQGVERMLQAAAEDLVAAGRLRLAGVAVGDETIAVQAMVAVGGEVSYWLGGFDERWARSKPALVALLTAVEDAFRREEERLDLGGGTQEYKLRFADGQETLESIDIVPRGPRAPLDRALLAPRRARRVLARATARPRAALRRRRRGRRDGRG